MGEDRERQWEERWEDDRGGQERKWEDVRGEVRRGNESRGECRTGHGRTGEDRRGNERTQEDMRVNESRQGFRKRHERMWEDRRSKEIYLQWASGHTCSGHSCRCPGLGCWSRSHGRPDCSVSLLSRCNLSDTTWGRPHEMTREGEWGTDWWRREDLWFQPGVTCLNQCVHTAGSVSVSYLYCCLSLVSVNRSYWEWAGFPSQSFSSTLREYWPWLVSRNRASLPSQCSPNTSPKPCRRRGGLTQALFSNISFDSSL